MGSSRRGISHVRCSALPACGTWSPAVLPSGRSNRASSTSNISVPFCATRRYAIALAVVKALHLLRALPRHAIAPGVANYSAASSVCGSASSTLRPCISYERCRALQSCRLCLPTVRPSACGREGQHLQPSLVSLACEVPPRVKTSEDESGSVPAAAPGTSPVAQSSSPAAPGNAWEPVAAAASGVNRVPVAATAPCKPWCPVGPSAAPGNAWEPVAAAASEENRVPVAATAPCKPWGPVGGSAQSAAPGNAWEPVTAAASGDSRVPVAAAAPCKPWGPVGRHSTETSLVDNFRDE